MIDSATINEAVDLLECAGWKGYAQAVREQSQQAAQSRDLLAALRAVVRVADRNTPEFDTARAAIAAADGTFPVADFAVDPIAASVGKEPLRAKESDLPPVGLDARPDPKD